MRHDHIVIDTYICMDVYNMCTWIFGISVQKAAVVNSVIFLKKIIMIFGCQ